MDSCIHVRLLLLLKEHAQSSINLVTAIRCSCFCYVVVCNHHFHDKSSVHKSYTNRFPPSQGSSLLRQFDFLRSSPVTTSSTDSHTCTSFFIIIRLRLRICPVYYAAGYREGKCFETINFWIWEVPKLKQSDIILENYKITVGKLASPSSVFSRRVIV